MRLLIYFIIFLFISSKSLYSADININSIEPKKYSTIYKDTKIKITIDKKKIKEDIEKLTDAEKQKLISKDNYIIEYKLNDENFKKLNPFNIKPLFDVNSVNIEDEITFVLNDVTEIQDLTDEKNLSLRVTLYERSTEIIEFRLINKIGNTQEFDSFKQNIKNDEDFKKGIEDYFKDGKINKVKIGTIKINKKPEKISNNIYYKEYWNTKKKANSEDTIVVDTTVKFIVKKLTLSIVDGVINNIRVTVESNNKLYYFKNMHGPISNLTNFDERSKLYLSDVSGNGYLIKLEDFLTLEPEKDIDFAPENSDFELINNETDYKKDLFANDNLNLLINARIYTNLISFFSNEQNTLLATEVSAKILSNNLNIPGSFSYYLKYIKLFGTYLKNNNSENKIDLTSTATLNKFGRIFTVANSVYTYGLELNLFEFKRKQNLNFDINLSHTGGKTIIKNVGGSEEDVQHTSWNLNPLIEFKALRNAGLELSLGINFLKFSENSFEQLHNEYFHIFGFNMPIPIYTWSGTLFYFTSNNNLNSVYFRIKSTCDRYEKEIVQFQTGFNVNIHQVKF